MKRAREILLYGGLALLMLLPRLPGLDSFATLDEPDWLSMGANFYYALGQREFQNTVYEYQPAVTTLWIVTAAMLAYFPEYRGLGQGYLEYQKDLLDPFLLEHGRHPLALLWQARLIQVLLIAGLMVLVFHLLQRLIGRGPALFAVAFASFDPFFLGQTRLLDHEAMLALFGLISVLALLVYLLQGRGMWFLVLSGVSAGLAQLTKSSGIAVLAPVGLLLLGMAVRDRRAGLSLAGSLAGALRALGVWLAVLALAYFILWPGMWVAPGKMLHQVYGNAFSYALQGARLTALEDTQAPPLALDTDPGSLGQLVYVILQRTSPLTWLGVLLGLAIPFVRGRAPAPAAPRWTALLLFGFALAFILMFGLAQGRNSPHYTLSSYLALNVLAGMGWFQALEWLGARPGLLHRPPARVLLLLIVLAAQARSALTQYPYYFTYENPILAALAPMGRPQFPYGEGLELAAGYLAGLPDSASMTALSYYGRGCFSYFYPGHTERFKPYYADRGYEPDLLKALAASDYLVIYYANQGHAQRYDRLLEALEPVEPEQEIWLNGYPYALIYRIESFPPAVYEALAP